MITHILGSAEAHRRSARNGNLQGGIAVLDNVADGEASAQRCLSDRRGSGHVCPNKESFSIWAVHERRSSTREGGSTGAHAEPHHVEGTILLSRIRRTRECAIRQSRWCFATTMTTQMRMSKLIYSAISRNSP